MMYLLPLPIALYKLNILSVFIRIIGNQILTTISPNSTK